MIPVDVGWLCRMVAALAVFGRCHASATLEIAVEVLAARDFNAVLECEGDVEGEVEVIPLVVDSDDFAR